MKVVKFLLKFILWVVAIVLAIVLTLPLWIGPVAKTAANAIVPKKTLTAFNLGKFGLNQYSGRLSAGDLQLGNPADFNQKMAFTLGNLFVDVDMGTVASDTIVIEDIVISDVFVSYVSNAKGENNFAIIAKNAKGGEKTEDKKEDKAKVKGEGEQKKDSSQPPQASKPAQAKSSKKVIIDHLLIENVLVQLGPVSVPLPKVEMKDIGRKSGGATMEEAWSQISAQVMASLNKIGEFANQLGKMGVNLGDLGIKHAGKAADAIKRIDVKGMTDAFKGGTGAVSEGAGKTVDAVSEGAGKAADAVSEQTGKAVDAIKGLFK